MDQTEFVLNQVPLFASLPSTELTYLARTLQAVDFPAQTLIFREGDQGEDFYVIFSGQVEIIKGLGAVGEHILSVRGPGEFIGEMSLLNHDGLRTAGVRAVTPVRLLKLTRADFDSLLDREPRLAYKMVRVLSERLNTSNNRTIQELQAKNLELTQMYEELKAAQAQLIQQEALERELKVAHNIQMSLLPRRLPDVEGFDFGAKIVPMTQVGGDFYDFIPLEANKFGVAVGDVSGHGVPAALFMALTVTLLRAEACHDCAPGNVLQRVNRQLLNLNDEGMFVSVLYGVLDAETHEFTYVRAGHNLPVVLTAGGRVYEPGIAPGMLLGLFNDPVLSEQCIQLNAGDTLLLYTDGVVEAMDAQGEIYGDDQFKAALNVLQRQGAQQVCQQILEQVQAYSGPAPQHDDITLVCLQAH